MEYEAPEWSCLPGQKFKIEVIKNGVVISEELLPTDREYLSVGRLPTCDISMEHASVSRHHAVLQFGQDGVFAYDLGSTHGTFLNKQRIEAKTHVRLPSDSILRFGESTRHYVISSLPPEKAEKKQPWKGEPLKFLRHFLKEQDEKLDLVVEADEAGGFTARIALDSSIFTSSSELLTGNGTGKSKKEASDMAAVEICQKIESIGSFVQEKLSLGLGRRRSLSPPGDDSFFDRTAKRVTREPSKEQYETVESLYAKQVDLKRAIDTVQAQLEETQKALSRNGEDADIDELDAVINELNSKQAAKDMKQLNSQLFSLQSELEKLEAVLKVVDPKEEFKCKPVLSSIVTKEKDMPVTSAEILEDPEESPGEGSLEDEEESPEIPEDESSPEIAVDQEEWIPPEETESERTRLLKEKYGY